MAEEQNHDNVTLADIQKDIKDMRNAAKTQYRGSLYLAAYIFSGGVALVGTSFFVPLITPYWQMFNALGFMLLGGGGAAYCYWKMRKIREKQTKTKEGT